MSAGCQNNQWQTFFNRKIWLEFARSVGPGYNENTLMMRVVLMIGKIPQQDNTDKLSL